MQELKEIIYLIEAPQHTAKTWWETRPKLLSELKKAIIAIEYKGKKCPNCESSNVNAWIKCNDCHGISGSLSFADTSLDDHHPNAEFFKSIGK